MIKNKLGLGPVVAVALLIVVSVVAVLGFQSWFQTYSSSTFTSVETQSQNSNDVDIQGIIGNNLYIKKSNNENLTINRITIDGIDCLNVIGNHSEKLIELNVSDCLENITTSTPEIVVHTDTSILQEQDYYKGQTSNLIINTPLPIPRNGLVAEYLFDSSFKDSSGNNNDGVFYNGITSMLLNFDDSTATDLTSYSNDGTINGNTNCSVQGISNNGCYFDGNGDYIQVSDSNSLDITDKYTISFWFNATKNNTNILLKGAYGSTSSAIHGWRIFFMSNNHLTLQSYDGNWNYILNSNFVYNFNQNYFITFVTNSTDIKLYIDGVLKETVPKVNLIINSEPLLIGSNIQVPLQDYQGMIDEISIYSEELSEEKIINMYNSQKAKFGENKIENSRSYANFDGIDDYLEPSTTFPEISSNKNWTYSINIKTTDYNAYLFNKGRYLNSADTNKIQISNRYVFVAHNYAVDYGNYTFYNNLILNNNWNNLVITYTDSNNLSVYVNSLLINSSIITDTAWADESGAFISRGLNNQHTDYALNVSMDNLRIYNRTLNITEIQALYEEGN